MARTRYLNILKTKREQMKRNLPYGRYIFEDGSQVLFNRYYEILFPAGMKVKEISTEKLRRAERHYFYTDSNPPWANTETLEKCKLIKGVFDEMMREKEIEVYLRDQVKKHGGKAYKFESPGNDGVPDRLVIFPKNGVYFVELKAPGKKPRPLQIKQMAVLSSLGCDVRVIDSKEQVDEFIREVTSIDWREKALYKRKRGGDN